MSDIQRARYVLAKWRDETTTSPWSEVLTDFGDGIASASTGYMVASYADAADARLIVGTAGNPDLLDAIGAALEMADHLDGTAYGVAEQFAAAILSADERMSA